MIYRFRYCQIRYRVATAHHTASTWACYPAVGGGIYRRPQHPSRRLRLRSPPLASPLPNKRENPSLEKGPAKPPFFGCSERLGREEKGGGDEEARGDAGDQLGGCKGEA